MNIYIIAGAYREAEYYASSHDIPVWNWVKTVDDLPPEKSKTDLVILTGSFAGRNEAGVLVKAVKDRGLQWLHEPEIFAE